MKVAGETGYSNSSCEVWHGLLAAASDRRSREDGVESCSGFDSAVGRRASHNDDRCGTWVKGERWDQKSSGVTRVRMD